MERGWWHLKIEGFEHDQLSESTLEHIAECIKQGYTQGEVLEETNDDEE